MPPKQSKNRLHELHVHVEVPIPVVLHRYGNTHAEWQGDAITKEGTWSYNNKQYNIHSCKCKM